jgi:hypothetical protein
VETPYDYKGLQSLFGYGRAAHERSGGICQLCGCGAGADVNFDLWRQFTVEHLIGESQGGYPPRIRAAVDARFRHLARVERQALAARLHETNIVTACQFCNSTTSRDVAPFSMEDIIADLPDDPDEAVARLAQELQPLLESKRRVAQWKLSSVYRAFRDEIRPSLLRRREELPALKAPRDLSALDVTETAPTSWEP